VTDVEHLLIYDAEGHGDVCVEPGEGGDPKPAVREPSWGPRPRGGIHPQPGRTAQPQEEDIRDVRPGPGRQRSEGSLLQGFSFLDCLRFLLILFAFWFRISSFK
jgi:hypothetical protein